MPAPGYRNSRPDPEWCRPGRHRLADVGLTTQGVCRGCQREGVRRYRERQRALHPPPKRQNRAGGLTDLERQVADYASQVLNVHTAYHAIRAAMIASSWQVRDRCLRDALDALRPFLRGREP